MKIYTKTGDQGLTDLFGGMRVLKNHVRVKAYGEIDAANSALGFAASTPAIDDRFKEHLIYVMQLLFCAGAEIATSQKNSAKKMLEKNLENQISERHLDYLESFIDESESELVPLKSFILPYGSELSSRLQLARTSMRRAEIALIDMREADEYVRPLMLQFFNRLSDFLFVFARLANKYASHPEILWSGKLKEHSPSLRPIDSY